MMKYKIGVYVVLFLVLASVAFAANATIDMYTHTVEVKDRNSFHTIEAVLTAQEEVNITLPPRVEQLRVFIDEQETSCSLEEKEGFSLVQCALSDSTLRHHLQMSFDTTYPLFKLQNQVLYKSEYTPTYPTTQFTYILKLQEGFIIPKDKDISFFVNPKPKSVYSDGQRIILLWEKRNVDTVFEISALMEPLGTQQNVALLVGVVLLVLLGGAGIWVLVKKRRTKKVSYPALIENERIVTEILQKAKDNVLWQKQIQIKSGFSKVKLSRVIRSLEQRGVVKKEPWGNTNKISLVTEKSSEKEETEE